VEKIMAANLAGFPFWTLRFDATGKPADNSTTTFLQDIPSAGITDLLIFSHGWNNDEATALALYTRFFGEMRKLLDDPTVTTRRDAVIGVAGVVWPAILFPGDSASSSGGAASFTPDDAAALESELPKVFTSPEQQPVLQELLALLQEQSPDPDQLIVFRDKLVALVKGTPGSFALDDLDLQAITSTNDADWMRILDGLSAPTDDTSSGGAADFGSALARSWNGAKNALRATTYWTMKNRAGVVGEKGLGPILGKIQTSVPGLNVHLLGHSFGARLVSHSLVTMPDPPAGARSQVKSLFLLQGAFSHFAFAPALPFDTSRKGDLAGMESRVDGPLLTTHSQKDLAVGTAYPLASVLAGQDASDATDIMYRWEGMGYDGAQAVSAADAPLGDVGTTYNFAAGKWLNLDGNQIIVNGDPPAGAHGDIAHPEIAWAALLAQRIGIARSGS
jgi:hypothetical protein